MLKISELTTCRWLTTGIYIGIVAISCASHFYDPGLSPRLRMWSEFCQAQSDSESVFSGYSDFPPSTNLTFMPRSKPSID